MRCTERTMNSGVKSNCIANGQNGSLMIERSFVPKVGNRQIKRMKFSAADNRMDAIINNNIEIKVR